MFSFTSSRDLRLTYQCLVWLVLGKRALQVSYCIGMQHIDLLEAGGL